MSGGCEGVGVECEDGDGSRREREREWYGESVERGE